MAILETVLGLILGAIIVGAFFLYLLAHFLDFARKGLKLVGIFLVLCVVALFFDLLNSIFSSGKDDRENTQFESSYLNKFKADPDSGTEAAVDQLLANFLSSYAANDQMATAYYMVENAEITKAHLNYMAYQQKQGISLELTDYHVLHIEQMTSDTYEVTVFEQFLVNHPKNGLQNIEQEILYTIQKSADRLLIKDLIIVE